MSKLFKLLSILSITASVSFWSCKGDQGDQGPAGPQGPQGIAGTNGTNGTNGKDGANGANGTNGIDGKDGKDGKDGNANVQSFQHTVKVDDWKDVDVAGVGSGETSRWGGVAITNSLITADKFVMVFVKQGEILKALPISYTKDMDNSLERLDYGYKTGQVELYYRYQTQMFAGQVRLKPNSDLTFDVVATSKTIGAALERSGVNMKNYNDVMNFISKSL